jgi:hypothetical protein
VAVFGPDNEAMANEPYMVFKVEKVDSVNVLPSSPRWKPPPAAGGIEAVRVFVGRESRRWMRSLDGKNLLREHILGRRA